MLMLLLSIGGAYACFFAGVVWQSERQHEKVGTLSEKKVVKTETCKCSQESLYINEMVFKSCNFNFCPWCGRKLPTVP
jgi:hypothetical protein